MRTGITLLTGVAVFFCVTVAWAQPPESPADDSAPWHLSKVAKRNVNRPSDAAEADDSQPKKYLHIHVGFRGQPEAEKKHKFRVVTESGDEVGELYGWSDDRSMVIFEGSWSDLTGLYLDGEGHREPLFQLPPEKKTEPVEEPKTEPKENEEPKESQQKKDARPSPTSLIPPDNPVTADPAVAVVVAVVPAVALAEAGAVDPAEGAAEEELRKAAVRPAIRQKSSRSPCSSCSSPRAKKSSRASSIKWMNMEASWEMSSCLTHPPASHCTTTTRWS